MACELYCCLLPQCEALRICRSGFPIATMPYKLALHVIVTFTEQIVPIHKHITLF